MGEGEFPPLGGNEGEFRKKNKKICHMGIVPENMCTKFDANTSIFRLFKVRGKFGGYFPPRGGTGGNFGKIKNISHGYCAREHVYHN